MFRLISGFCSSHGRRATTWLGAFGLGVTLVTLAPLSADAASVNYRIGSVDVAVNGKSSGLQLFTDSSVLNTSVFTLNDGQSATLAAFRIGTMEKTVDLDDLAPKMARATFFFSLPTTANASVKGVSFGIDLLVKDGGVVLFGSPDVVTTAVSTFRVSLDSVKFGVPGSAVVKVNVKQLSSRQPIPEPASVALFVSGGAFVVSALRRRRQGTKNLS
jgi:hypothetical protein